MWWKIPPEPAATARVEDVSDVTPHNKALYEAGKKLLVESLEVGREFCKFMTTTSISAIPVYLALLKLLLPEAGIAHGQEWRLLLAPSLWLISSVVFILGYFPRHTEISLDLPNDVKKRLEELITRRVLFASIGFILFALAVAVGAYQLIHVIPLIVKDAA